MPNKSFATLRSTRTQWLAAMLALGLLVIALWLPYGLNVAGWGDEWVELSSADAGAPLVSSVLRAFVHIPSIVSHALTPDSFAGMNLVLAVMTFGRGILMVALLRKLLPQQPALALVAGALTVVYPGDLAFYLLVSVSITTALVCFIGAILALVHYWERPRWYILLLMWVLLGFSVGIYEVSYPLIAAVPLVLVYLNKGLSQRVVRVAALWYLVPVVYVVLVFAAQSANPNTTSYQLSIVNPDNSLSAILSSLIGVYVHQFKQVWQSAALNMPQGFSDGRTWLTLAVTSVMAVALLIYSTVSTSALPIRKGVVLISGALVAFGLGYVLFMFTGLRDTFTRTLFYTLPPASLIVAVIILLVAQLERIPRYILALVFAAIGVSYFLQTNRLSAVLALLIAVGFLVKSNWRYIILSAGVIGIAEAAAIGFHQTQPYANVPEQQHQLAAAIAEQAPAIKSQTLLLWIASPDAQEPFTAVLNRYDILQSIMQFVYKQYDIEAQLCIPDGSAWGAFNTSCQLERDAVVISFVNAGVPRQLRWTYDRVIAFTTTSDHKLTVLKQIPSEWMPEAGAESYDPDMRIDHTAPTPYRLQTVWTSR
jgi:hypothetical protein